MVSYNPLYRLQIIRDDIIPAYERMEYIPDDMYHYLNIQIIKMPDQQFNILNSH